MAEEKLQEFEAERKRLVGVSKLQGGDMDDDRFYHSTQTRVATARIKIMSLFSVDEREPIGVVRGRMINCYQQIITLCQIEVEALEEN